MLEFTRVKRLLTWSMQGTLLHILWWSTDNLTLPRGMRVMFLPPYSPDYNPIELAFSSIKAFVQRARVLNCEDVDQNIDDSYVYLHLFDAAFSITAEKALGYYHHCGYVWSMYGVYVIGWQNMDAAQRLYYVRELFTEIYMRICNMMEMW